jgi:hypothetical protein
MTKFSILLALNLAALALVFLYVRSRVRKALESDGLIDKLRAEVGELVRDLNQTTDRNLTLVEDAIRALREASAEADRKTAVLRRETERRSTENAVDDRLGRMRNAASVSEEGAVSPPKAEGPRKPVSAAEALPLFDSSRQEDGRRAFSGSPPGGDTLCLLFIHPHTPQTDDQRVEVMGSAAEEFPRSSSRQNWASPWPRWN